MASERARIEHLARWLEAAKAPEGVLVSIGDDAAVLAPGAAPLVLTVDAQVEGVHFRLDWLTLEDLGFRSLMAAASDLAAMGARPRGVLSSLILPRELADAELEQIARGQHAAAALLGTAVIGGNLARGAELSVTTTVLGEASRPLCRDAARPGDVVALHGAIGLARAGLLALEQDQKGHLLEPALHAWRRPVARLTAGLTAAPSAHAMIDLSDGLSLDAARVAEASEVRLVLQAREVLAAAGEVLARAARALGREPLELALTGGEDYALLGTFPQGPLPPGFVAIGRCAEGAGLELEDEDGSVRPLAAQGFDHFG